MGKVRKMVKQTGREVYSQIPRPPGWKDLGAWQWTKHVLDLGFRVAFPPLAHSWPCNLDPLPWSWPISGAYDPERTHLKKLMNIILGFSLRPYLKFLPFESNKTPQDKETSVHSSWGAPPEFFFFIVVQAQLSPFSCHHFPPSHPLPPPTLDPTPSWALSMGSLHMFLGR